MACCNENKYDFCVNQGASFALNTTYKRDNIAVNLTGYTARMQLRTDIDSATATLGLTTENGGIALGGTAGTVSIVMTATQTTALANTSYVYDLELVNGATVLRYLQGKIKISPEVTR